MHTIFSNGDKFYRNGVSSSPSKVKKNKHPKIFHVEYLHSKQSKKRFKRMHFQIIECSISIFITTVGKSKQMHSN